jgi:hypothetical protein
MNRFAPRSDAFCAGCLLLWLVAAGCAGMPKDLVLLDGLDRCPTRTPEKLLEEISGFEQATDTFNLQCALGAIRAEEPESVLKSAGAARLCFLLADRMAEEGPRRKYAAEGLRYAEKALSLGLENDGAVHYYLAVNLGLAVRDTVALAIKNLSRLESELKQAVALTPEVDQGGPLRVLGMLYLLAPAWPQGIGDSDKALELLAQAASKHSECPLNHMYYAQALFQIQEEDAKDQVQAELLKARDLINLGNYGQAKERWLKDLGILAQDAKLTLPESR